MDLFLTLIRRELLGLPRRRWFYPQRLLFVGLGTLVLFITVWANRLQVSSALGLLLFSSLAYSMILIIWFFGPAAAAHAMRDELESRSLEILALSDVSLFNALMGRFSSALGGVLMTLLSLLPLLMLCLSFGGISFAQLAWALAVLLANLLAAVSFGILCALLAGSRRGMRGLISAGLIAYLGLPMLILRDKNILQAYVQPLRAIWLSLHHDYFSDPTAAFYALAGNCGISVVAGALMLALAGWLLPRLLSRGFSLRVFKPRRRRPSSRSSLLFRVGNPCFIREFYRGSGRWLIVPAFLLITVAAALIARMSQPLGFFSLEAFLGMVWAVWLFALFFGSVSNLGRAFSRDRKLPVLELVLMTPLTERDYVYAKVKLAATAYFPYLIGVPVGFVVLLVWLMYQGPPADMFLELFSVVICFATLTVAIWLAFCAFSLYYSLRIGKLGGLLMPVFFLVYIIVFGIMFVSLGDAMDFQLWGTVFLLGLFSVVHFVVTAVIFMYLVNNFRRLARQARGLI